MVEKGVAYKCINCEKEMELDLSKAKRIICTFCGHRILKKVRAPVPSRIIVK